MTDGPHFEDRDGARWITLDRADCKNALTPECVLSLTEAVRGAKSARAIVLRGNNQAFCSGLDLRVALNSGPLLMEHAEENFKLFQALIHAIVTAPQPSVAVLDGVAYGFGCDLSLACDLRVASTRAYFQEGFVRIGLVPDGGGTWMLPRLVGLSKALELALLGERLDAASARSIGLLARLVEPEELEATATALVAMLTSGPPMALAHIKRLMRAGLSLPFAEAYEHEGRAQMECLRSNDCIEGIVAFFQKRPAVFQGL